MKYSLEELEKLLEDKSGCICDLEEKVNKLQTDVSDIKHKINLLKDGIIIIGAVCIIGILVALM